MNVLILIMGCRGLESIDDSDNQAKHKYRKMTNHSRYFKARSPATSPAHNTPTSSSLPRAMHPTSLHPCPPTILTPS